MRNVIYDKHGQFLRRWGESNPSRAMFALPTLADLRPVNPVTQNLSIADRNEAFVWDRLAPVVEVSEKSGTVPIYSRAYWARRQQGLERAPDGPYQEIGYGVDTTTYDCIEYGAEIPLGDVTRAGSQFPDDQEVVQSLYVVNTLQIELEKLVAAVMFVTGAWTSESTLAGVTQWSDYDASDPIAAAKTAVRTIRLATGVKPNLLFIGSQAWDSLKDHPLVTDRYKYTTPGVITPQLVAPLLDIEEIVVGETPEETGAEGAASSTADIWTDNALFAVMNKPGLMVPAGGFTFMWNEKGNIPWAVDTYRNEGRRSLMTRAFTHAVPKVVSKIHGYLYLDCVA